MKEILAKHVTVMVCEGRYFLLKIHNLKVGCSKLSV